MAINFNSMKRNLVEYFREYRAKSERDAANFITNEYESAILTGGDMSYKNPILSYNKSILRSSIQNAFEISKTSNNNRVLSQMISQGLIGFWTGAKLILGTPPPGSISIVSNIVTVFGTPQSLIVNNTKSFNEFANSLITIIQLHLKTISGVTTALVPTTAAPVPTPFPWFGYE